MDRPTASPVPRVRPKERGFTLIELITVIAILAVLVGIALPNYRMSLVLAKEAVLLENLSTIRRLLDQYASDKGEYPQSLQVLVDEGYLRDLPKDPMTGQSDWQIEYEQGDPSEPGKTLGIYDVHSSSIGVGMGGEKTPYSEW